MTKETNTMKAKELQDLISFIADSGLDEVSIETNDFKVRVKRNAEVRMVEKSVSQTPIYAPAPMDKSNSPAAEKPVEERKEAKKYLSVRSPMIGTFYRSSSPEVPAFAQVGDEIGEGKVLCIIEAMKLFNEIESEISGRIVKVLVENATPVEYDQELFLVEPI